MPSHDTAPPQRPGDQHAARAGARPFYGWIILSGLCLSQIVSWGILYFGFGVLLLPMQRELGWSSAQLAGGFSAGLFASAIAAMPLGRYIDRHGARGVMTTGSCAAGVLLIAWSRVHSLWAFYVIWIGLGLAMAAVLYESAFAVVVAWFERRRAEALAVLTSIGGLASTVFVPATAWLEAHSSWRTTLVVLAGILVVTSVPVHALIVRSRPSDLGLLPDGESHDDPQRDVVRVDVIQPAKGVDWILAAIFALSTLSASAVAVHVMPFLLARGHATTFAAGVMAIIGVAQVPGRLAFAALARWVSPQWFASSVFVLQAAGLGCLWLSGIDATWAIAFAVLFGAGNGLTTLVRSTLVAEWFGTVRFATISGKIALAGQLSRAAGPVVAAWLATRAGGAEGVWAILAVSLGAGACVMLAVQRSRLRAVHAGIQRRIDA